MNAIRTACVAALALSSCLWAAEKPKDEDPIWKRFDDGPEGLEIAILASKTTVKVNELVRLYLLVRNAGETEWPMKMPIADAGLGVCNMVLYDGTHLVLPPLPGSYWHPGGSSCGPLQPGRAFTDAITHRWDAAGVYRAQIVFGINPGSLSLAVMGDRRATSELRGLKTIEVPPDRFGWSSGRQDGVIVSRFCELPRHVSTHPIEITATGSRLWNALHPAGPPAGSRDGQERTRLR